MTIPDNFAFRFGDLPQYLHYADKDDQNIWHISWDRRHVEKNFVSWYTCTESEIANFIAEEDGWVLE